MAIHTNTLQDQFDAMLQRGIMPLFEFELPDDEYLIVNLSLEDKGIYFDFDDLGLPVSFDGEIIKKGDSYLLPVDPYFDDLDHYLQMISDNINEGFLIPNNLLVTDYV